MMKFKATPKRIFCAACLLLLLSLLFVSCTDGSKDKGNDKQDEAVFYTVTFNTVGGNEISPMRLAKGSKINQPATPVRENYIFVEWRNGLTPWDFENSLLREDITLTAHWASADSVFNYTVIEGTGTAHITGVKYFPETASITVPKVIKGYTVTGIGDGVFGTFESEYITEINIPDTVEYVGSYAFEELKVALNVYGSLAYVGEGAFTGCVGLKSVSLAEGLEVLPYAAFSDCTRLSSIVIPEGVTKIEENAFKDCTALVTAVIPKSAVTVENSAFHGCESLKSIFYGGTDAEFDKMDIHDMNQPFTDAKLYFYSETEATNGDFWHFDEDGKPRIW